MVLSNAVILPWMLIQFLKTKIIEIYIVFCSPGMIKTKRKVDSSHSKSKKTTPEGELYFILRNAFISSMSRLLTGLHTINSSTELRQSGLPDFA